MKFLALLTVGAITLSGPAFAVAPSDANIKVRSVKSEGSQPVIVAVGKQRALGVGTSLGSGRTIFGG